MQTPFLCGHFNVVTKVLTGDLTVFLQDQKKKGVIAASAGNHALALSFHRKDLGSPVTVVMPLNAPIMKISACRKHGATVHVNGADLIEVLK